MSIAQSKLTAQGQISVPSAVRKKLGLGPGSVLEWDQVGQDIVVRKSGRHTSVDAHKALFPEGGPRQKAPSSVKEGIAKYIRRKHARG